MTYPLKTPWPISVPERFRHLRHGHDMTVLRSGCTSCGWILLALVWRR